MTPCVGIQNVCPPLARRSDFKDGTLNMRDCLEMHLTMKELRRQYVAQMNAQ